MTTNTLAKLENAKPLRSIPIPGDPSNPTRTRWVLHGILNARGERVKLQAWKIGGRLMTTELAIDQFLERLNCNHVDDHPPTDEEIVRRGREAGKALEALGC